jgi:hypothetical protein
VRRAQEIVGKRRETEVSRCCSEIERGMRLVGCSAVEDRLQDDVPETLHYLLEVRPLFAVLARGHARTHAPFPRTRRAASRCGC